MVQRNFNEKSQRSGVRGTKVIIAAILLAVIVMVSLTACGATESPKLEDSVGQTVEVRADSWADMVAVGETISSRFEEPLLSDGSEEHQGGITMIEITPDMRTEYWFDGIDSDIPVYSGHDDGASDSRFVVLFSTIYHKVEPELTDQLLFKEVFALKGIAEEDLIMHAQMVGLMDLFDEVGGSDDTVSIEHDEMEIAWVEVDQYGYRRETYSLACTDVDLGKFNIVCSGVDAGRCVEQRYNLTHGDFDQAIEDMIVFGFSKGGFDGETGHIIPLDSCEIDLSGNGFSIEAIREEFDSIEGAYGSQ